MVLKKSIVVFLTIFAICMLSCKEVSKEMDSLSQPEAKTTVTGTTHYLNDDGIKIVLPDSFVKYSAAEYEGVIKELLPEKDQESELDRLRTLRTMDGNFYLFYDKENYSTYTANTIPYKPITKRDATNLLTLIRSNLENSTQSKDLKIFKETAKYNDNGMAQIFKAVFKIDNIKTKREFYQTAYFISSNDKTVLIQLSTPFLPDFDPYLQQMVF